MKIKEVLRNYGEKKAVQSVDLRSWPRMAYQPKLPAKVQKKIDKIKSE